MHTEKTTKQKGGGGKDRCLSGPRVADRGNDRRGFEANRGRGSMVGGGHMSRKEDHKVPVVEINGGTSLLYKRNEKVGL